MSEKIDITIDSSTDVEAENEIVSSSTDNNIDIEILEPDYNVTVNKREYVITGDNLYIPKTYDESPQWIKDIIGTITDFSLNQKLTEIGALSNTLYALIDELEVAKNTYTNSIITSAEIDERINARIETLNSSIAESDATIVDLITTKATPTEASTLALNVLTSSINDGAISSLVSNLQSAISTTNSTLSNNIDIVHAEMTGEFNANAEVINSMQAYVGIDEAGASTGTGVSAYLEGSNGVIGSADSNVANNVYVDNNGNSRSKFEYNSSLNIGGTSYNSGFGLSNSAGTGVGSEFWINADKFKFTNNDKTGSKAPFTIDATGTVPEITFNGKVSFNNVTDYTSPDISGTINNNNDVFAQRLGYLSYSAMVAAANSGQTIINGGYVNTSLLQANSINAGMINTDGLIAENISANEIVGKIITGAVINGAVINGAVVKASYLDLDGELEVLTNYHITPAMYNANPSLYTDAVYLSGSNEYRIPSISNISSLQKQMVSTSPYISAGNYTLTSNLYSYASANVGNNMKVVKVRPTIIYIESSPYSTIPENYLYNAIFKGVSSGSGYFRFYIGDLLILALIKSENSVSYSGLAGNGSIASPSINANITVNLSYGGMIFSISRMNFYGDGISIKYSGATNLQIIDNWTSGQIRVEADSQVQSHPQGNFNSLIGFRLPAISINNMI